MTLLKALEMAGYAVTETNRAYIPGFAKRLPLRDVVVSHDFLCVQRWDGSIEQVFEDVNEFLQYVHANGRYLTHDVCLDWRLQVDMIEAETR